MKIAVVGYGIEGKAVTQYFRRHRHEVTICDQGDHAKKELEKSKIHMRLGPHYLENLESFDCIFRSPGIPFLKKEFKGIRGKLTSLTKYFFENCPCPIVGVTGTKGKGTVSALLYEMLKKGLKKKVFLGGNMGRPPIEFLDDLKKSDLVVLELSSFQLQDLRQSPHVAVVLGITPDHLDHHRDMEEYIEAKRNIVRFQKVSDFTVLDTDNKCLAHFEKSTPAKIYKVSTENPVQQGGFLKVGSLIMKDGKTGIMVGQKDDTKLLGPHNLKNILAAAAAAHLLHVPVEIITQVIREFPGLPHRLEFVKEVAGVTYYNDSASTNPLTAVAAIKSFRNPLILIVGGSDKGADFTVLGEEIARSLHVKTVILMGTTKPKIETAIETAISRLRSSIMKRENPLELITAETYQEAFMVARFVAKAGDTVLLSPGCASFDMFKNYQERGDVFRNFVLDI